MNFILGDACNNLGRAVRSVPLGANSTCSPQILSPSPYTWGISMHGWLPSFSWHAPTVGRDLHTLPSFPDISFALYVRRVWGKEERTREIERERSTPSSISLCSCFPTYGFPPPPPPPPVPLAPFHNPLDIVPTPYPRGSPLSGVGCNPGLPRSLSFQFPIPYSGGDGGEVGATSTPPP